MSAADLLTPGDRAGFAANKLPLAIGDQFTALQPQPTAPAEPGALLTDFYQLAMMSAYYKLGMEDTAVFEFSVRRLPERYNFLVAAGLEQVLDYAESLHFSPDELAWLEATREFDNPFLDRLERFRFSGDILALPEGTVCFVDEPILRVTAPLPEAQLLESRLINLLHYQTLVASKAARCRIAAGQRTLVDYGMRRAHGAEAAMLAARACYIAGFDATSNVEAARRHGIPFQGTMAHSFVQAHERELDAFRAFAKCRPGELTLLIDTYDIARGTHRAVKLAKELSAEGRKIANVRIDSGDLGKEARLVRSILDQGGCEDTGILVSGGLDESAIRRMMSDGAPINGFCVGTELTAPADCAAFDCGYKLQQYAGTPRRKRSQWKCTWPGRRQIYRLQGDDGRIAMDVVGCADEIIEGKQLLQPVMAAGRRTAERTPLLTIRRHCAQEIASLPAALTSLEQGPRSPVKISHALHELADELDRLSH